MKLTTDAKCRLVGWADQATGIGLKVGIPVFGLSTLFLLVSVFGSHLKDLSQMAEADRNYLISTMGLASMALIYAGTAVVASVVVRLLREEVTGQALSLVGVSLFLGSPFVFASAQSAGTVEANALVAQALNAFRSVGVICFVPGMLMVMRDVALRLVGGITGKRVVERRWGDEEERLKKHRLSKIYSCCWDMAFCRDFVRKVCPAFTAKKSCWRLKVGCYCDEKTILLAMTSGGKDKENVHMRGIMQSLGLDKSQESKMGRQARKARCRRCGIYAEHQRQKYRLLSPLVFPAVGVILYVFYDQIGVWVRLGLMKADKFMSFLTYSTGGTAHTFGSDGRVLTVLAFIWVTIIAISYALRALEYFIFELQV